MTHRRPLIAGNWKMNGLQGGGRELAQGIVQWCSQNLIQKTDVVLCPPFTLIHTIPQSSVVAVGAQDCHAQTSGAHTGDVSAPMLKDAGCSYVILGHSERRADHHETDGDIQSKALAAQAAGLTAIICVGESLDQRDGGQTFPVIKAQILTSVPHSSTLSNTVIAYEPIWAIGTGKVASPDQAQEVHAFIRNTLIDQLGGQAAQGMRILYGGSMKPDNAASLLALPDVDGGLIGGAALKVEDFTSIIASANKSLL